MHKDNFGHCMDFGVPLPCLVPLFRKEEGRVRWCSAGRGPEGRARAVAQGYQVGLFRTHPLRMGGRTCTSLVRAHLLLKCLK